MKYCARVTIITVDHSKYTLMEQHIKRIYEGPSNPSGIDEAFVPVEDIPNLIQYVQTNNHRVWGVIEESGPHMLWKENPDTSEIYEFLNEYEENYEDYVTDGKIVEELNNVINKASYSSAINKYITYEFTIYTRWIGQTIESINESEESKESYMDGLRQRNNELY